MITINEGELIQTAAIGLVGGAVALIGFLLKRQLIDRSDRIEAKLDALTETVADMAENNAREHRSASDRTSVIEGRLGIQPPHNLKRT